MTMLMFIRQPVTSQIWRMLDRALFFVKLEADLTCIGYANSEAELNAVQWAHSRKVGKSLNHVLFYWRSGTWNIFNFQGSAHTCRRESGITEYFLTLRNLVYDFSENFHGHIASVWSNSLALSTEVLDVHIQSSAVVCFEKYFSLSSGFGTIWKNRFNNFIIGNHKRTLDSR